MEEQIRTRAVLYRGGTSKAFIVKPDDLPTQDRGGLTEWLLAAYGSPDARQIDGVGGADGLTSKFAIVGLSSRDDADVDYTFAQVGVDVATVDWSLICGNITSAIGPYAIDEGFVAAVAPVTRVRVHSTNTGKIIECLVQVRDGRVVVGGDEVVDGVPGSGAPVLLDFRQSVGVKGAGLLPTGNPRDVIEVDGLGPVEYSMVDAAVPTMFVRADRFGLSAAAGPKAIEASPAALAQVDSVRAAVAASLGWASSPETARVESRLAPIIVLVGPPEDWAPYGGTEIRRASDADLSVRAVSYKDCHKAFPVTGSVATAAAAATPGTLVHEATRPEAHAAGRYRLAHPSGSLTAVASVSRGPDGFTLDQAGIVRTARRILDGCIYTARTRTPLLNGPDIPGGRS